jgi:hypothetical protein
MWGQPPSVVRRPKLDSVTANIASYPGYYELPNNFMKPNAAGHALITAYAVARPDAEWPLMLINKDQSNSHQVGIAFEGAGESPKSFSGAISMVTLGSDQYMWKSDGPNGHPDPDSPPVTKTLPVGTTSITLPKASVTVLRGNVTG